MKKETDLGGVKAIAKTLLMTAVNQTPYSPMLVQHPFTSSGLVALPTDKAAWLSLPAQKQKVKRVARELSAGKIEDCVYLDFESCVPQITSEQLGDMRDFDKFNRLATMMFEMSPRDQVQFKAVLEAEKPADIDGVIDIAENMWRYDSYGFATDESEFFKHYLLHHLDTRFDPQWLDSINAYNEGAALLDRLGAKITPYCNADYGGAFYFQRRYEYRH